MRLEKILQDVGRKDVEVIDWPEAAEHARVRGSPTFLFDDVSEVSKPSQTK